MSMPRLSIVAAITVVAQPSPADDWTGWRGSDRNAINQEGEAPLRWSASKGVLWSTPVPGAGISSPIVHGDRVFLSACGGHRQQDLELLCLAARDGSETWRCRFWGTAPTRHHATKSSMASPTPVTDGERVFAFYGTGDLFAVDVGGVLLWHRSLASEYGPFENRFAATSSPVLHGDRLILQCDHFADSYLIAVDRETGATRWKVERPETWLSWSSPRIVPVRGSDRHELIVAASKALDAFDPLNGEKLWTLRGMRRECIPTPVFGNGLIYAVSGPSGPTLAVRPGGRGDVTNSHVVWRNTRGSPYVPSAILVQDLYYLVDDRGIATCLDAKTGERVWQKRLSGSYTASPVSAAGRVYFTNENGATTVIRADVREYEELARNELGQPVYASAAIAGGVFYLRTSTHLWAIGGD